MEGGVVTGSTKYNNINIILENATVLGERSCPHAVLRNVQKSQLFPNLTFGLQ